MPKCLDKKRNEIISAGEYYPLFEDFGMNNNNVFGLVLLQKTDSRTNDVYHYSNGDFTNFSWWEVIYNDGRLAGIPIVNITSIDRIED